MTIEQVKVDMSTAVLTLSGRLDTASAPVLERKIKQWGEDITELVLDFADLDYISSMGLRVLLVAKKALKAEGRKLTIKNMTDPVRDVFEMTGFLNLMVQEEKFVVIRRDDPDAIRLMMNGQMELEHIPMVSKELFAIREEKKCIPAAKENEVPEGSKAAPKPVKIILDMERLTDFAPVAIKHLSQAINDTAWEGRTLRVRGALPKIQALLEGEGLGKLLEPGN